MTVIKLIQELKINQQDIAKAIGQAKVSLMHSLNESELALIDAFLVKRAALKQGILSQTKGIESQINLLKKQVSLATSKAQRKKIRMEIGLLKNEIAKLNARLLPSRSKKSQESKPKKSVRKWVRIISTPMGS